MSKVQTNLKKDAENRMELTKLIEKMTTSGRPVLDEKLLKPFKRLCRESDDYICHVFHMLVSRLRQKHAEIRLSAFQICAELFVRSHCFRDLFLSELQNLLKLILEIDPKYPLPPPRSAAAELQRQVKQALKNWNETFGQTYKKLSLCYNYLQKNKQINFLDIQTTAVHHQLVENERRTRLEAYNLQRLNKVMKEIEEVSVEINASIVEAESVISLLLESVENVFDGEDFCSDRRVSGDDFTSSKDESSETGATSEPSREILLRVSEATESSSLEKESGKEPEEERVFQQSIDIKKEAEDDPNELKGVCNLLASTSSESEEKHGPSSCSYPSISAEHTTDISRQHGLQQAFGAGLRINITSANIAIQETNDNLELIQNLEDQQSLLSVRHLPTVKKWLKVLAKLGSTQENLKTALQMKVAVESTLDRINKLNVTKRRAGNAVSSRDNNDDDIGSSSDEDFEEVMEKDGFEAHVPLHLLHEARCNAPPLPASIGSSNSCPRKNYNTFDFADPTVSSTGIFKKNSSTCSALPSSEECQPSTSGLQCVRKPKLLSRAPIVSFGSDLCSWDEKLEAPLITRNNPESHWWSASTDDAVDILALHASKSRVIDFSGSFKPVRWTCRAPRGDGTLCERMDRHKCPFHGKIVARTKEGVVENCSPKTPGTSANTTSTCSASTSTASTSNAHSSSTADCLAAKNDWDDPELQADIQAATGIDLSRKGRGGRKGKRSMSKIKNGLTDITQERKDICRKRLEEKVLSRSAMKRVASSMNVLESKRHMNTYANNFNYAFRR